MKQYNCCTCGVVFALPDGVEEARREDGKSFFCLNGHEQVFRPSENTKLKKRITTLKQQLEHTGAVMQSHVSDNKLLKLRLAATQGVVTKMRKKLQELK